MATIECRNCKTMIDAGINFCPRCGTPVNAAVNPVQPAPPAAFGGSLVTLHRQSGMLGWAVGMHIFLDGQKVGQLGNGAALSLTIPPGNHDLQIKGPMPGTIGGRTVLLIQPGKTYQIELSVGMGFPEYKVNFQIYMQ